jgi:ADP-ribose pyrophosphatase YjhB (NUDIX family)
MRALSRCALSTTTTTCLSLSLRRVALVVAVPRRRDPRDNRHLHSVRSSISNSSSNPRTAAAIDRKATLVRAAAAANANATMATTTTTTPPSSDNDPSSMLLTAKDDAYGGVIIDDAHLPADPADFEARLAASLAHWKQRGVRGVWLKLPPSLASHVSPAISQHGFGYHHAEPGYVMLTRWLPLDEGVESGLPPNASHQVGVGALVVDARRGLVLAVQERTGPLKGRNVWKLPTGLVHAGEDLHTAAEREVEEETGVKARFAGVLAVRQAHGFAFGKSDLFFLCALVADDDGSVEGGEVAAAKTAAVAAAAEDDPSEHNHNHPVFGPPQPLAACEREIERAAWLTVDAYEREQSRFNGHLPLYSRLLGRSVRFARAAVAAFGERAAGGGDEDGSPSTAVRAAVVAANRMGMRGQVLDGGIWKPRTDLLLWGGGGEEDEDDEEEAGGAGGAADAGGGAKL